MLEKVWMVLLIKLLEFLISDCGFGLQYVDIIPLPFHLAHK